MSADVLLVINMSTETVKTSTSVKWEPFVPILQEVTVLISLDPFTVSAVKVIGKTVHLPTSAMTLTNVKKDLTTATRTVSILLVASNADVNLVTKQVDLDQLQEKKSVMTSMSVKETDSKDYKTQIIPNSVKAAAETLMEDINVLVLKDIT